MPDRVLLLAFRTQAGDDDQAIGGALIEMLETAKAFTDGVHPAHATVIEIDEMTRNELEELRGLFGRANPDAFTTVRREEIAQCPK